MTQNSVSSVILKFTLDEQAQRRAIRGIADINDALEKTRKSTVSVDGVAERLNKQFAELARTQAIDKIAADAFNAAQVSGDWAASLEMVAQNLSDLGASDSEIAQVANTLARAQAEAAALADEFNAIEMPDLADFNRTGRGRRGGGGGSNLDRVDRLGSIGSQLLGGLGQGELANVAGIVGDVAGGIGSLGVAGVAAAGALGAISVAMSEYNRQLEAQKTALRGALDAQNRYYEAIGTLTSDQASAAIESEQGRIERLQQQRQEVQAAIDNAFAQAQQLFGGDVTARALEAAGQLPTAQLREQLAELDAALASSEGYVARLAQGQAEGVFATNDMIEAEKRLADQRTQSVNADFDALQKADALTAAQREEQISANTRQIQLLQQQGDALAAQGLSTDAVNESINRLAQENAILETVTWSLADAKAAEAEVSRRSLYATEQAFKADQMTAEQREARSTQISQEIAAYRELLDRGHLSADATAQLTQQITNLTIEQTELGEVTESTADKIAKLAAEQKLLSDQTDNYFKATEATVKAQEALTKAQADAQKVYDDYIAKSLEISTEIAEKEREILADGGEKRADIERKTQESIAKLMRDNGREQFNAVAERDALALFQSQQQAKDELDDERKAAADQIKEQEKAQAKQLASLQSSADKQTRALDASYRNQQAIAATAQLRAQVDLQNAKAAEIAIAANGANGMRSIVSNMWGQLTIETVNGVNAILTATRRLVGTGSFTGTTFGGTTAYVNGVNIGSPAAYDLFNVSSTPATFNRLFDSRLNQTLQISGASSPR